MKNIIIIGMPGCGKTTIGSLLAKQINREFIDVDKYIEERENQNISDIFKHGEEYFRNIETIAIKELSDKKLKVISTGGGVVKNYENIKELKKNGTIIFINRYIEDIIKDIDINERPLLKDKKEKIYTLFNERYNLYKKYCDYEVINNKSLQDTIDKIIKYINLD